MGEVCGFEVKDSEEIGRFIIAKRMYRTSDLILDEKPLIISPVGKQCCPLSCQNLAEDLNKSMFNCVGLQKFSVDLNKSTFDCVGCFKSLSFEEEKLCPKCFWPVCSNTCAQESLHAKYECALFEEKKIGVSDEGYRYLYILRAVLMCRNEEKLDRWERFASLMSTYSLNQDEDLASSEDEIERIKNIFKQCYQINVDPKLIGQIIRTYNINAFGLSGRDQQGRSYRAYAVYYLGSMLGHSCAPNCEWVIKLSDHNGIRKRHLKIHARRTILPGEPINISYIEDCFALNTAARRSHLSSYLSFDCKCARCKDVSEFSLYTEAIICSSCGDETLTADNTSHEFSNWTCKHCGIRTNYRFAKTCVENFDPSLIWNSPSQTGLEIQQPSFKEKCGLSKYHRKIVLSTYYWIEKCSKEQFRELLQNSADCDQSFVKFMKMITTCRKVLGMFGSMANIVDLEWWFARIIAAFYFKTADFNSIPYDEYLPEEKLKILTAICAHLKIVVDTLEWLPLHLHLHLLDGCKFWKDELNVLKNVRGVDLSDSSEHFYGIRLEMINEVAQLQLSTNDLKERSTKSSDQETSELNTSTMELSDPGTKESQGKSEDAAKMEKMAVSQSSSVLLSDIITFSGDYTLLVKPPVALLTKYDFYFDG